MKITEAELTDILMENRRLRAALKTIAEWDLPRITDTTDPTVNFSYETQFGSNGARDYVKDLAKAALS